MPKARRVPPPLTDAQEARIQAGIASDPDNPELTEADIARLRSFRSPAAGPLRGFGSADTKVPVKLRLDRSAVDAFKATGAGWQTRMNDTLVAAAKRLGKRET